MLFSGIGRRSGHSERFKKWSPLSQLLSSVDSIWLSRWGCSSSSCSKCARPCICAIVFVTRHPSGYHSLFGRRVLGELNAL
jgi:hypothetical protein